MTHADDNESTAPMQPTIMPKTYKLRFNGSLLIPESVLAFLGWSPGDEVRMTVDAPKGQMILTRDAQKHKAISDDEPGASVPGSGASTRTR